MLHLSSLHGYSIMKYINAHGYDLQFFPSSQLFCSKYRALLTALAFQTNYLIDGNGVYRYLLLLDSHLAGIPCIFVDYLSPLILLEEILW